MTIIRKISFLIVLILLASVALCTFGKGVLSDQYLSLPIIKNIQHNYNLYNENDLLVQSGSNGPFLLYRLIGENVTKEMNLVNLLRKIYLPIFILYIVFWGLVFFELSESYLISIISIIFFLFSDDKLCINWSFSPIYGLISLTSVHFLQICVLLLFFRKKYLVAFLILGASSFFHPASSLVLFSIITPTIFLSLKEKSFIKPDAKTIASVILYSVLTFLAIILSRTATSLESIIGDDYWEIFRNFQYHVFPGDHFHYGYLYTFLFLCTLYISKKHFGTCRKDLRVFNLFFWGIVGSICWLLNIYVFKVLSITYTFYIMRVFYYFKPLIILYSIIILNHIWEYEEDVIIKLLMLLLSFTIMFFSPIFSMLLLYLFIIAFRYRNYNITTIYSIILFSFVILFIISKFGIGKVDDILFHDIGQKSLTIYEIGSFIVFIISIIILDRKKIDEKLVQVELTIFAAQKRVRIPFLNIYAIVLIAYVFVPFMIDIAKDYFVNSYNANDNTVSVHEKDYSDVVEYFKENNGMDNFVIVPPDDHQFIEFRYDAEVGIFIHYADINQLMYTPSYYSEGFRRLKIIGLNVNAPKDFSWNGYSNLDNDILHDENITHVIYRNSSEEFKTQNKLCLKNETYSIYRVSE